MKREITEYETNNLDIFKFIGVCKYYIHVYNHKTIAIPKVAMEIWKMIQEDVFNINYSETAFNKLIDDIGYVHFYWAMYSMCCNVIRKEEEYINYINNEDKDCISLIGEPIYKFMHKIEELLPYED